MRATHYKDNGGPVPRYYSNQDGNWFFFSLVRWSWVPSLVPYDRLESNVKPVGY